MNGSLEKIHASPLWVLFPMSNEWFIEKGWIVSCEPTFGSAGVMMQDNGECYKGSSKAESFLKFLIAHPCEKVVTLKEWETRDPSVPSGLHRTPDDLWNALEEVKYA